MTELDRLLFPAPAAGAAATGALVAEIGPDERDLRIPPNGGVLVFDGYCGFCTRAVLAVRRLDRLERIRALPLQAPRVLDLVGITRAEAVHEAYWLGADGVGRGGAGAMAAALQAAVDLPALGIYGLPGIRQAADRGYRWVAGHRRLLRGVTPYCEAVPDAACGPDVDTACGCQVSDHRQ